MGLFSRSSSSSSSSGDSPAPQLQGNSHVTEPATVQRCREDYKSGATTRAQFTKQAKSDGWGRK